MLMIEVLQLSAYAPDEINVALENKFSLYKYWELKDDPDLLEQIYPRVKVVATKGDIGLSSDLMEALPNLELIAVYGAGYDKIDLDQAKERDIKIVTTPDALVDTVADFTAGLILASSRRIAEGDAFARAGTWTERKLGLGTSIREKKLGIVGYGRIGRRVAQIMRAGFDMQILYYDMQAVEDDTATYYRSLTSLARDSDVLVLSIPATPDTQHIIDKGVLEALGPKGLLINVARGALVNTPDLIAALKSNKLGAAALDVFEDEPNIPPELLTLPNTVLTPHLGSATHETRRIMGMQVLRNIASWHEDNELQNELVF